MGRLQAVHQGAGVAVEAGGSTDQRLLVALGQFGIDALLAGQRVTPRLCRGVGAGLHVRGQGIHQRGGMGMLFGLRAVQCLAKLFDQRGMGLLLDLLRAVPLRGGVVQARGHCVEQLAAVFALCSAESLQRAAQIAGQLGMRLLLVAQGAAPGLSGVGLALFKAAAECAQLGLHRVAHAVLQLRGLLAQPGQRVRHQRLQRFAHGTRALRHAVLQGLLQGAGQLLLAQFGRLLELLLAAEQALTGAAAVLLNRGADRFQPLHQRRQQPGLGLQQAERFGTLPALRMHVQGGGNAGVELLHHAEALASAQCRQQAEHGRGGDTGDGGAEGDGQALDRCAE